MKAKRYTIAGRVFRRLRIGTLVRTGDWSWPKDCELRRVNAENGPTHIGDRGVKVSPDQGNWYYREVKS